MRGEWIEIIFYGFCKTARTTSLPMRGEWIEMFIADYKNTTTTVVSPHAGRVD